MRTRLSLLIVLLMLIGIAAPAPAAPPGNPFVGSWEAYDPRDGGTMHLRIGANLHIVGSDTISTICRVYFDDFSLEMRVSSSGVGYIDEEGRFVSEGAEYFCYPNGPGGRVSVGTDWPATILVAHPDGTLTWEGFPFVFHRTGNQSAPPHNPFVGSWASIYIDDGPVGESEMQFQIAASGHVHGSMSATRLCLVSFGEATRGSALGWGSVISADPYVFAADVVVYCHTDQGRQIAHESFHMELQYEPNTDTLVALHYPPAAQFNCYWRSGADMTVCP